MGVSECSVGVLPAKSGSFGHKTIVLHRRDARATLFCKCLSKLKIQNSKLVSLLRSQILEQIQPTLAGT